MAVRIPKELTLQQLQTAIRDLDAKIDATGMTGTGVVDLKNRRMVNAGKSQSPQDYVTRQELEGTKDEAAQLKIELLRRITSAAETAAAPAAPTAGLGGSNFGFGYYLVDVPGAVPFGDFYGEVKDYINTYHCWFGRGFSSNSSEATSAWLPRIATSLARAVADGKKIHVLCDIDGSGNPWMDRVGNSGSNLSVAIDLIMNALKPYWNNVATIDLSDEGITTTATADLVANALKAKMTALALPVKPIGTILTQSTTLSSDICRASSLDYIGIEAYVEPPAGTGSIAGNKAYIVDFLNKALAAIAASKKVYVTLQAYARNGAFTDIPALVQLQLDVFDAIKDNPRVIGMMMFSYGRSSGTRELSLANPTLPTMKSTHIEISKKLVATTTTTNPGGATCGGLDLPPECKRYCRGGDLENFFTGALDATIAANPALFVPGAVPPTLNDVAARDAFTNALVAYINTHNTTVQAIVNTDARQEVFLQRIPNPLQLEIFAAVASNLQIRRIPGAYIATCIPGF